MNRLAALRLRRAALRLEIAATRAAATQSCDELRARVKAAALGLSLARAAGAAPRRWRLGLLAALAAVAALRTLLRRDEPGVD